MYITVSTISKYLVFWTCTYIHEHQIWGDYKAHVIDYDYDYLKIS